MIAPPTCDPPPKVQPRAVAMLPPGTCDTHFHVFGAQSRYPMDPRRGYTPHESTLDDYREAMRAVGVARGVIVQPSVYGTDNSATLDALREGGAAFRAIVVPPAGLSDSDLASMHDLGVRGIRLNLVNPQMVSIEDSLALLARVEDRGWHLQVQIDLAKDPDALPALCDKVRVPVVVDHMGKLSPPTRRHPLLDLVKRGACWVKLSAPYRVSAQPSPHADLVGLVHALADANPARMLWASDWPHTELHHGTPTAASLANLVATWFPDMELRRQICVRNPARLYGYDLEDVS